MLSCPMLMNALFWMYLLVPKCILYDPMNYMKLGEFSHLYYTELKRKKFNRFHMCKYITINIYVSFCCFMLENRNGEVGLNPLIVDKHFSVNYVSFLFYFVRYGTRGPKESDEMATNNNFTYTGSYKWIPKL